MNSAFTTVCAVLKFEMTAACEKSEVVIIAIILGTLFSYIFSIYLYRSVYRGAHSPVELGD